MSKNSTLFLHLPAYREPELIPTIKDALKQAKYPERLHFGICRQYEPSDGFDDLTEYKDNPNFHIHEMLAKDAQGLPYARAIINEKLLTNQDYILQLDSHHRFVKGWDSKCIRMLKQLQKKGHKKPLLTGYIPSYNPKNDPEERVDSPWKMDFDRFTPEGVIFFLPATIDDWKERNEPVPARFFSAHFTFTLGIFCNEVQHDPKYYFHGEEIALAVRAYIEFPATESEFTVNAPLLPVTVIIPRSTSSVEPVVLSPRLMVCAAFEPVA